MGHKQINPSTLPVGWARARAIFGNASSPKVVWQHQFDLCHDKLKQLAATPYRQIDLADLWYYYHDLAYEELQGDLFNYLFPVCLMNWHGSLLNNEPCSRGDADFHYGVRRGKVFERMLSPEQRDQVWEFFRDSFLERLDQEREFRVEEHSRRAHGWIERLNSLGIIMPRIDLI